MSESSIEKRARKYAISVGAEPFKMNARNKKGVHDHLFIACQGSTYPIPIPFFIEFKTETGGKVSKLQEVFFYKMEKLGVNCYLGVDYLEHAKCIIDWHVAGYSERCPDTDRYAPQD